jgi:hypothetical protein
VHSEVHYSFDSGGALVIDTAYPFKKRTVCLSLKTAINQKIQRQLLQIEVLGSEIVTLKHANNLKEMERKVYYYSSSV